MPQVNEFSWLNLHFNFLIFFFLMLVSMFFLMGKSINFTNKFTHSFLFMYLH